MPTYDYVCDDCGHEFDYFQTMSADPLKTCPECGEDSLRRLIGGGAGLVFKGSGYYLTDYVRKGNSKDNGTAATTPAEGNGTAKKEAPASGKDWASDNGASPVPGGRSTIM